jgi:ribose transport system substrate-binding protein
MRKFALISLSAAILCSCLPPAGSREAGTRPLKVEFSFGATWLDVYQAMEDMLVEASEKSGKKIEFQFWYADNSLEREASNIRRAIGNAPDILVLMPINAQAILTSIESAHRKGIPVIVYNRQQEKHESIKPEAFIGLDTYNQAYTTAAALFKLMRQERIVPKPTLILGDLNDRNAVNRQRGFKKAAEEFDVRIAAEIESLWDEKKAGQDLSEVLDRLPGTNAVLLSSDFMIGEIRKVLSARGRWAPHGERNHVFIGAQDGFKEAVPLIRDGYIDVDTAFDIRSMSTILVQTIWTIHNGRKPAQEVLLIPGRVLTKSNIDDMKDLWSVRK